MPDLSNIQKFISAGFDMAQWAVRGSSGAPYGRTGTISQDANDEMERLFGVKTADVSVPEAEVVNVTGDDGFLGSFLFASNEPISFVMEVGQSDMYLASKAQGMTPYAIGPYWDINFLLPDNPVYTDLVLLLTSQAKSQETNQQGSGYHNVLLPFANVFYLGRGFDERGAATFRFSVTTSKSSTFPWGAALDANTHGTGKYIGFEWFSQYRATMGTYIDNGAAGQFTLDRTAVAQQHILAWSNGVGLALTGYTPSTRVVTFSAGTAGDEIVYVYEYS